MTCKCTSEKSAGSNKQSCGSVSKNETPKSSNKKSAQ